MAIATQTLMEAAASLVTAVTPGRQHFHPGHPKAGGNFNGSGTPAFRTGDYGMGAITDGGTGDYTLALDTAFADTNFWITGWAGRRTASGGAIILSAEVAAAKTTSSMQVQVSGHSGTVADSDEVGITFWGDYA